MGLSRVQLEANQFQAAYETSLKALELDPRNPRVWEMFGGMAAANNRFDEVLTRIDRLYPQAGPAWASALRTRAQALQDAWAKEQQTRLAERAADNLPRVRLTIEHQSFRQAGDGGRASSLQTTGRDDVELELFEDQAPATVANFLVLVERGFYNGTRFHWVEAGGMAVGGDANTKNADPDDDGIGGPGYVIPDEFRKPGARLHFRGSVAMVESAAHTAGSQFFIELVPHPEMNHHLTVFGRVVKGQEGVDRITSGRTNLHFGKFGKPIPGDVIVRAEVIRKRPHPYRIIKE
jgi:cyclophilin family peptidyl-prolyl cis-trans isomerase